VSIAAAGFDYCRFRGLALSPVAGEQQTLPPADLRTFGCSFSAMRPEGLLFNRAARIRPARKMAPTKKNSQQSSAVAAFQHGAPF